MHSNLYTPGRIVFAIVLLLTSSTTFAADWPHDRGPGENDISAETEWSSEWPGEGPVISWKKDVGHGYSGVTVVDGRVFTMGNMAGQDIVHAVDLESGETLWTHSYACESSKQFPGTRPTPTVEGGHVYTYSRVGELRCLKSDSGDLVWSRNLVKEYTGGIPKFGVACHPLIVGERLYIYAGGEAGLLCLEKKTGKKIWNHGPAPGKQGYGSPHRAKVGDRDTIGCFSDSLLWGVNPESGELLWSVPWKAQYDICATSPLYVGNEVFVSTAYGVGCGKFRIDGAQATEIWRNKNMKTHFSNAILHDGHIYGASGDNRKPGALVCIDWEKGEVAWKEPKAFGPLTMAGDRLIIITWSGTLVIAKASSESYQELARAKVLDGECWTAPVLSNNRIFARSNQGHLVCVDVTP